MIMAVLFAVLFGAIFFGIPICFSLAMSSWAALSIFEPNTNMVVLAQRIFTQADNYVFLLVLFLWCLVIVGRIWLHTDSPFIMIFPFTAVYAFFGEFSICQ